MTAVISLYGKSFLIGFSEGDNARRVAYFKSGTGNLTPQEKSLLLSLGIDAMLENSLKPYLAEFFSTLQTCSSDASLILSKNCETAYFVIWSAMFHNNASIARRMKEIKGEVISDIDLAQDAALISGMRRGASVRKPVSKSSNTIQDDIARLFTIMVIDSLADSAPVSNTTDYITRLFTPMLVEDIDDDDDENYTENSNMGSDADSDAS